MLRTQLRVAIDLIGCSSLESLCCVSKLSCRISFDDYHFLNFVYLIYTHRCSPQAHLPELIDTLGDATCPWMLESLLECQLEPFLGDLATRAASAPDSAPLALSSASNSEEFDTCSTPLGVLFFFCSSVILVGGKVAAGDRHCPSGQEPSVASTART